MLLSQPFIVIFWILAVVICWFLYKHKFVRLFVILLPLLSSWLLLKILSAKLHYVNWYMLTDVAIDGIWHSVFSGQEKKCEGGPRGIMRDGLLLSRLLYNHGVII